MRTIPALDIHLQVSNKIVDWIKLETGRTFIEVFSVRTNLDLDSKIEYRWSIGLAWHNDTISIPYKNMKALCEVIK